MTRLCTVAVLALMTALLSCQRPERIRVFYERGQVMFDYCDDDTCDKRWPGILLTVTTWDEERRKTRLVWTNTPNGTGPVAYPADAEPLIVGRTYKAKFCKFVFHGDSVEMIPSRGCFTD